MAHDRLPAVFSWKRCLLHLPVGILAAIAMGMGFWCEHDAIGISLGILVTVGWFAYEFNEDAHIGDHAYIDFTGFLAGSWIVIGGLITLSLFNMI